MNAFLWQMLRDNCPELFDTGQEHGPWLYGDTRIDHGPYPWMSSKFSYYAHFMLSESMRKLERKLLYGDQP